MELEHKKGNIGIKVDPSLISVNPSRESIRWDEITKNIVLQKFRDVVGTATAIIQDELKENDFVKWLRICYQISHKYNSNNSNKILSRLASVIDLNQIWPTFQDTNIKFDLQNLLNGLECNLTHFSQIKVNNKYKTKIERRIIRTLPDQSPVVLYKEKISNRKDKYLLSLYKDGFVGVRIDITSKTYSLTTLQVWQYLNESSEIIQYEQIIVPDDFSGTEDEEYPTIAGPYQVDLVKERRIAGKVVLHTPRLNKGIGFNSYQNAFEWQKIELPIVQINEWKEEEIYWGNDEDSSLLKFAALLTRTPSRQLFSHPNGYYIESACINFYNTKVKLVKVAKNTIKYYQDFSHIKQFFLTIDNNTITMSNTLVKWNTARQIRENFYKLNFLYNFPFEVEQVNTYNELREYIDSNYREIETYTKKEKKVIDENVYTDLLAHLEKIQQFQFFIANSDSNNDIKQVAKDLWGNESITDARAIELDVWNKYLALLDWAEPVYRILIEIPTLTGLDDIDAKYAIYNQYDNRTKTIIPEDTKRELQAYLCWKGVI